MESDADTKPWFHVRVRRPENAALRTFVEGFPSSAAGIGQKCAAQQPDHPTSPDLLQLQCWRI